MLRKIGDIGESFGKKSLEKISAESFISRELKMKEKQVESDISLRSKMIAFLFWMYGFFSFSTVVIIFLQGFKVKGFNLAPGLLHWLGAATVGEIGILAQIAYKALFKKED